MTVKSLVKSLEKIVNVAWNFVTEIFEICNVLLISENFEKKLKKS